MNDLGTRDIYNTLVAILLKPPEFWQKACSAAPALA